jgi:CheY-like chemotaxis protein
VLSDGTDAVDSVRAGETGRFDGVLMDLPMPRMDGFEATRRMRALPRASQAPVIAMSAAVLPADRAAAQRRSTLVRMNGRRGGAT